MKKATVLSALSEFPGEFRLDQLIERLIILDKIEEGLKDAAEGKTVSPETVKKAISKWQSNLNKDRSKRPQSNLHLHFL